MHLFSQLLQPLQHGMSTTKVSGALGLGTIADYGELEEMRTQPTDIHVHETNEFTDNFGWSEDGVVPTAAWLDWVIYQPGQQVIIDFADANGHQDPSAGINAAADSTVLTDEDSWTSTGSFTVTEDPFYFQKGITNLSVKLPQILLVNTEPKRENQRCKD